MANLIQLANLIREKRSQLGYTQQAIADKTELEIGYICKIENNQLVYAPSRQAIAKLAEVLGLDEYELNLSAGHIPFCIKPLVCQFLLVMGDRAPKIMKEAINQSIQYK